jgi:uncharacterized membrane protein
VINDLYLRRAMLVLAVLGIGVTAFLTILHYGRITVPCAANGNPCEVVQTSIYSHILGIPVALLGLIGYIGITASLLAPDRDTVRLATLGLTLFGFAFSGYLTYREAFTLHEYCEWCLSSAGMVTLLFIAAVIRYVRGSSVSPLPG